MPTINDSVQFLKGVGPAFAKKNLRSSASSPSATCFCAIRANTSTTRSPYTVVSRAV